MVYIGKNKYRLGRMLMSHMVATTLEELHAMADKIGVSRRHFQDKPERPHYDVCQIKKALALDAGATEVSDRIIVTMLKNNELCATASNKTPIF